VRSPNIRYLVGLDHLRALAALLIVFYHGLHLLSFFPRSVGKDPYALWIYTHNPFVALLEEGHTAVALFMVLSGFVFSVAAAGKEIDYFAFLKNRFLRIYPLFVFMLLVGSSAFPKTYTFLGALQSLFFQADFQGAADLGSFSQMFWAVGVEFQFYLLFPFLHRFLERHGMRWAAAAIALCLLFRLIATLLGTTNARDISYWHLIGRLDQFLIGMLTARVFLRLRHTRLRWGWLSVASTVVVLAVILAFNQLGGYPKVTLWKVAWPTVEALAWAPLLLTYTSFADRVPAAVSRPLAAMGSISYSLYLLHLPCIAILPRLFKPVFANDPNLASQLYVALVILPVLVPLAALSYYVIERPFLAQRVRYLRDPVAMSTHHSTTRALATLPSEQPEAASARASM
jgi:peptidoglycan/LPS O-acetylase OafA/YrhL